MKREKLQTLTSVLFPYDDFLYMLQLELYYPKMYFSHLGRMFFKRNFQRTGKLELTDRIRITKVVSVVLTIGLPTVVLLLIDRINIAVILLLYLNSIFLIPLWIGIVNSIFALVLKINSQRLYQAAIQKTSKIEDLKSIVIVGSFGKTTTKNFLNQIVQFNYKTQMIPGNINTPDGIAKWIIDNLKSQTELIIYEADGWSKGEIAQCCKLAQPDIVIITNIGDQHLERLGTRRNLAKTLRESILQSKDTARIIMSRKTAQEFNNVGVSIDTPKQREIIKIDTYNPPKYLKKLADGGEVTLVQVHDLMYAIEASRILKISNDFIQDTIKKIEIPERRTKIIDLGNFRVLDDSYNISLTTAKSAIHEGKKIAEENDKRLLVITAGIPELGMENINANVHLGMEIGEYADFVVVINSILANEVKSGLTRSDFKGKIHHASSMNDAWEVITQIFDPNEVFVLMFPELTDLYY
ncbi:hypothetical protein GF357_04465 [Candidatus Dojkabacteria bacterium]|nr:hypothetical protein [Candidatus Dojkabacteria bacterium]